MKSAKIFDNLLLCLGLFGFCFVWCKYYRVGNPLALCLSLLFVIAAFWLLKLVFRSSTEWKAQKKEDVKNTQRLKQHLLRQEFSPAKLWEAQGYRMTQKRGMLLAEKEDQRIALFTSFRFTPLSADELNACLKKCGDATEVVVYCAEFRADCLQAAALYDTKVTVKNVSTLYRELVAQKMLPNLQNEVVKKRKTPWLVFRTLFCRARARHYLLSALFLILSSFVVFFPLYYLLTATVLLLFSVYARFNRTFNDAA